MITRKCPLCGSQKFFLNTRYPAGGVLIGVIKSIAFYTLVCLTCGAVHQTVDEAGLATARELAEREEEASRKRSNVGDLHDL